MTRKSNKSVNSKQLRAISIFSGAGGIDYGFEAAGFETAAALEMDRICCETLRKNRSWPVIEADIHEVTSSTLLQTASLARGELSVLFGGPPCQPFSKAGYWANGDTKRLDDARADTLFAYMRMVDELLPEVFLLENVHGISYTGKEEGFQLLLRLTDEINQRQGVRYRLSWKVLNTADYGVPQLRTRFFLIGHREGLEFTFPEPTHKDPNAPGVVAQGELFAPQRLPFATAWDAIGDLEIGADEELRMRGQWADLLPSIPEGENYLWHTSRKGGLPLFGWRRRYWSFLLKLAKDKPSWTIQAQPGPAIGPFHWQNRLLSRDELCALQTFPKDVKPVGNRFAIQKQLGNAVPSLMAEILAREIAQQFFGKRYARPPLLAVKPKRPTPPAEPLAPVPEKYRHLIGEHSDHPGTGKGRAHSATEKPAKRERRARRAPDATAP